MIRPCLNLRAGSNGSSTLVGRIPDNTTITIDCTARGNSMTGPFQRDDTMGPHDVPGSQRLRQRRFCLYRQFRAGGRSMLEKAHPGGRWRGVAIAGGVVVLLGLAGCTHAPKTPDATGSAPSPTTAVVPSGPATDTSAPSTTPSPSATPTNTATQISVKPGTGRILLSPCAGLRSAPRSSSSLVSCVPHNTIVTISCTTTGSSVTGPYGASAVWDHTTYKGKSGYLSDAEVFTGMSGPAARQCATSTSSTGSGRIDMSPCLNLHTGPNVVTVAITCVPYNVVVQINCTVRGTSVTGPFGASTIWDHTTYAGKSGYLSDAYVNTGKSGPVAATCAGVKAVHGNGRVNMSPCLNMHTSPGTSSTVVQCVPDNVVVQINCTAHGTSVTGPFGATTIWDHTTYAGKSGYLSDAYVYTGVSGAVAKAC